MSLYSVRGQGTNHTMTPQTRTAVLSEPTGDFSLMVLLMVSTLITSVYLMSPLQITGMVQYLLEPISSLYGLVRDIIRGLHAVYREQQAATQRLLPEDSTYSLLDWMVDTFFFSVLCSICVPFLALYIGLTTVIDTVMRLVLLWTFGPLRPEWLQWWMRDFEDEMPRNIIRWAWRWL